MDDGRGGGGGETRDVEEVRLKGTIKIFFLINSTRNFIILNYEKFNLIIFGRKSSF